MSTKKAPCAGPVKDKCSQKEYAHFVDDMRKMFPSWEPEELREHIRFIRAMAEPEQVIPGVIDSAVALIPGAGVLELHFDGKGGVLIDPASDFSQRLLELGRALRVVLGDKCQVGRLPEVSHE